MQNDYYITELENRIAKLITQTKNKFEILKEQASNITSVYSFYQETDDLADLIKDILFYRRRLEQTKKHDNSWQYRPTVISQEEQSQIRHQKLTIDKEILVEIMSSLDKAIADLKKEKELHRLVSQLEMQRFRLTTELESIKSELRVYEGTPDLTDGEIDIYLKHADDQIAFQGIIYLHATAFEIGEINYRGQVDNKWLGDIGYTIREKYQGHNFAYKALCLIAPLISAKGIDKAVITTYEANIASRKTIEKFGGTLKEKILTNVLVYECDLKKILEDKPQTSVKL